MANYKGNPNIAKYGQDTRFQSSGKNCPHKAKSKASPPWSIKRAARRIASVEFDKLFPLPTEKELRCVFCPEGRYITGSQALAIRMFLTALNGDIGAMQKLTLMIDGPLPKEEV